MILIWDNGAAYSDHSVYFVDLGEDPERQFQRVEWLKTKPHGGEIVGLVEVIEWRADGDSEGATVPWSSFARDYGEHSDACIITLKRAAWKAMRRPTFDEQQSGYWKLWDKAYEEADTALCNCGAVP